MSKAGNVGIARPLLFRVIFVRHGETAANKERRLQGQIDIPLNDKGEAQSIEAGKTLMNIKFDRAYASDLCRAQKTCQNILSQNVHPIPPLRIDKRISERSFGVDEGKLIEEVTDFLSKTNGSWGNYTPEGGETFGQVQERTVAFFKELCQSLYDSQNNSLNQNQEEQQQNNVDNSNPKECVLVVSHGMALRGIFTHLHKNLGCELPPNSCGVTALCPNTGISEYLIKYSPKDYELKCIRFYEDEHLSRVTIE